MPEQQQDIEVFGKPAGVQPQQPETPESKETPEVQPAETQTVTKTEEKTETPEQPVEPKQAEQKTQQPAKTGKEKSEFKVTFGNEKPEKVETPELKDEVVLEYLKKKGLEINSFDELKKPELPEQFQKALQFTKETGRGLQDFLKAQQDWTKAPKEQTIKEFFRTKYPNLTDEQIKAQIDLIKVTDEDKEELSEREIKQMELEYAKVYSEALNFMQEQQKKYFVPQQQPKQKQLSEEEVAKLYKPYWDKRDKSLEKLKEIKISLDGYGDIKVNVPEEDKRYLQDITLTEQKYFGRWADEKGQVNTDALTEDTLWSIKESRERMLSNILEQAHLLFMQKHSQVNRNVDLNNDQPETQHQEQKGRFVEIGGKESEFYKPVI